jgi:hypothetical protein
VSYNKKAKKWYARVGMCGGKEKFIGSFDDEIAAARAYDAFLMAQKLHKPLNFPNVAAAKEHIVKSKKLLATMASAFTSRATSEQEVDGNSCSRVHRPLSR